MVTKKDKKGRIKIRKLKPTEENVKDLTKSEAEEVSGARSGGTTSQVGATQFEVGVTGGQIAAGATGGPGAAAGVGST